MDEVWRNHLASIRPDADLAEADWWDTTWDSATPAAVGFLIPRGFEAYARVLHPASTADRTPVGWATVAAECGTTLHPQAQWMRLAGHRDLDPHGREEEPVRWAGHDPNIGLLERWQFEALVDVLGRHTATPERTFIGFWVGYGVWPRAWFNLSTTRRPVSESYLFERPLVDVPTLCAEAPAVAYALRQSPGVRMSIGADRGPSDDELFEMWAPHQWQSPSVWWPADHAWTTSTDVDIDSTLVGGSPALVDELIADERLEVLRWPVDGSLWSGADNVNR